ncbi:hypothetical protein AHF37_10817 [Paragonimus kellicotti]|nr:hypothetical protein AHF37_10817 [Paragonimus kellicotti]
MGLFKPLINNRIWVVYDNRGTLAEMTLQWFSPPVQMSSGPYCNLLDNITTVQSKCFVALHFVTQNPCRKIGMLCPVDRFFLR